MDRVMVAKIVGKPGVRVVSRRSPNLIPNLSVLIVDEQEETRQVLRTVLERRGMQIFEATRVDRGLELARHHHPNLIVIDVELQAASTSELSESLAAEAAAHDTPVILLGSVRQTPSNPPAGQVLSKPYHYGPLIRKIEELLAKAG
jgi:CheY-like chemotaxis protein